MYVVKKHQGAASILLLMFLPIMLLAAAFTIYTSQQYLTHIRNIEATEVAALALIAREDQEQTEAKDIEYAKLLIQRYLRNSNEVDVYFDKQQCGYQDGCANAYVRNTLSVSTTHSSVLATFPLGSGATPFFEPLFSVRGGEVTAERYAARPVDIYFIADFSGSMTGTWGRIDGVRVTKLDMLKRTIKRVLAYLEANQDPDYPARVSMSVYNEKSVQKIGSDTYTVDHSYRENYYSTRYFEPTYKMMWIHPKEWENYPEIPVLGGRRKAGVRKVTSSRFYDLAPTTDYSTFSSVFSDFRAGGGTASWQGMIAAAQTADKATNVVALTNPEQLFILLSDGEDGVGVSMGHALMGNASNQFEMCNGIKERLSNKENRFSVVGGGVTKVTMGVIGMGYNVRGNPAFRSCFGDKIYVAESGTDDVYKNILKLLNDVSGRFKVD